MSLMTIFLTTALVTAVFYDFFRQEILNELRVCAEVLEHAGIASAAAGTREEMGRAGLGWSSSGSP